MHLFPQLHDIEKWQQLKRIFGDGDTRLKKSTDYGTKITNKLEFGNIVCNTVFEAFPNYT